MFGTDPVASFPIADSPDLTAWRQGAIVAVVKVQPSVTTRVETLPKINATVTTKPGR